jgi:phospholipid/cholesterol/gamma-HCH transport system permease protein
MIKFLGAVGKNFLQKLDYYGGVISLTVYSFFEVFRKHSFNQWRLFYVTTVKQVFFTAYQSIKNVFFVLVLVGAIAYFVLFASLEGLVSKDVVASIFIIVIFRELLPIIVIVIIIARSVSAIAVEIGNMTVNKEFDIFVSMGIDPLFFLVLPRIVGMVISTILLLIIGAFVILFLGPTIMVLFSGADVSELLEATFLKVSIADLLLVFTKGVVSALFLPSIASYHGFKTSSKNLVPVAATKGIIASLTFAIVVSVLVTVIFYIFVF